MKKHTWTLKDQTLSRHFQGTDLLQLLNVLGGPISLLGLGMLVYQYLLPDGLDPSWVLGALVLASGLALLTTRHGAKLEGPRRRWTTWWGILVPCYRRERQLDGASAVEIRLWNQVIHGGDTSYVNEHYGVYLLLGRESLRVDSFLNDLEEARWTAESVSRVLGVRYRDLTAEPVVEKTPDQLDESLGQQYRRTGEKPPEPGQPAFCRAIYSELTEGVEIHIPEAGLANPSKPAAGLAVAVLVPLFLTQLGSTPWLVAVPIGLLAMLLTTAVPLQKALQAHRLTETLRLTPKSLRVESSLYGDLEIPQDELEELVIRNLSKEAHRRETQVERYFRHGILCARSDRAQARFGGALEREELEYARDLLLWKIATWAQS